MKFKYIAIGFVAVIAQTGISAAQAEAIITWSTPISIISADQALSQGTNVAYAAAWTGSTDTVTVSLTDGSSVIFQGYDLASTVSGANDVQVIGAAGMQGTGTRNYSGTSNTNFNDVLNGSLYDGINTVTLRNLTPAQSYTLQLFSLDNRGCCIVSQHFEDSFGTASASFMHSDNVFLLGNFIANATTQTIIGVGSRSNGGCATGQDGSTGCSYLNALVLYNNGAGAVPEPASWAMLIAGFGLTGATMRRRRTTAISA